MPRRRDDAPQLPELSDELRLALADVAGAAREGLLAMSVAVGLRVLAEMMGEEVTTKVGPKHAKLPERAASRHGTALGSVVLGGRRVKVERPRARTAEGTEVALDTYAAFARRRLLATVVMERMLAGLATRRHRAANEPVGAQVEAEAPLDVQVGGEPALRGPHHSRPRRAHEPRPLDLHRGRPHGRRRRVRRTVLRGGPGHLRRRPEGPGGPVAGRTENTTVVTHLLADLVDRGLSAAGGLLVVIDGAKALAGRCARSSATTP